MSALRALTGDLAPYESHYSDHRQLVRFQEQPDPVRALCDYMHPLCDEARRRGLSYPRSFNPAVLPFQSPNGTIMAVTAGQMECELWRYAALLSQRGGMIEHYEMIFSIPEMNPHPIFEVVPGPVAEWEIFSS